MKRQTLALVRRCGIAILAALVYVASAPRSAPASVARIDVFSQYGSTSNTIVYDAGPGERNALTVSSGAPGSVTFHDAGAAVSAGPGCASIDAQTARCTAGALTELGGPRVSTGDLDHTVTSTIGESGLLGVSAILVVEGGDGDDELRGDGTLRGGSGSDALTGGMGADTLAGGAGVDILQAGAGDDVLYGDSDTGPSGTRDVSDLLDGGPGSDLASYATRTIPVTVDLLIATGEGSAGERDVLRGIENVAGGTGDDTLRGDNGPNKLIGSGGKDTLDGRGGDDTLSGGGLGRYRMTGGEGNDHLLGGQDSEGGPGNDTLTGTTSDARLDGGTGDDSIQLSLVP